MDWIRSEDRVRSLPHPTTTSIKEMERAKRGIRETSEETTIELVEPSKKSELSEPNKKSAIEEKQTIQPE